MKTQHQAVGNGMADVARFGQQGRLYEQSPLSDHSSFKWDWCCQSWAVSDTDCPSGRTDLTRDQGQCRRKAGGIPAWSRISLQPRKGPWRSRLIPAAQGHLAEQMSTCSCVGAFGATVDEAWRPQPMDTPTVAAPGQSCSTWPLTTAPVPCATWEEAVVEGGWWQRCNLFLVLTALVCLQQTINYINLSTLKLFCMWLWVISVSLS